MPARWFGHIPGVPPGSRFENRRALHDRGVHRPLQAGISGAAAEGADSIVISGGYEDDKDRGDVIVYTGHGGNDPSSGRQVDDQELVAGNAALVVSHEQGYPVRVIRGAGGDPKYSPTSGYRYDGLYDVTRYWEEVGRAGYKVYRYELVRRADQGPGPWQPEAERAIADRAEPAPPTLPGPPLLGSHVADVAAALELAVETVDTVASDITQMAQESLAKGGYKEARALIGLVERLAGFHSDVRNQHAAWTLLGAEMADLPASFRSLAVEDKGPRKKKTPNKRAFHGTGATSEKTSHRDFMIPILQVLEDLGGKGSASEVLNRVASTMGSEFTAADLEKIPSNPKVPRWRKTGEWARQQLVNDGLMKRSRQRGIWEISDAGRRSLRESRG